MTANELRIGNYVTKNSVIGLVTCVNIDYCVFVNIKNGELHHTDKNCDFEPIPLTEEWLLKFGFIFSYIGSREWSNYDSSPDHNTVIEFVDGKFYFTGGEGIQFSRKYEYVHQLQNLYFALTGEELQIK